MIFTVMEIIGISGYSKAGKNLFAAIAENILKTQYNKTTICIALADEIKENVIDTINKSKEKNNVSDIVKNQSVDALNKAENKERYRPMLIAYGNLMRDLTNGKYWTSIVENKINKLKNKYDVIFVPDIRYNTHSEDECGWLLKKMNGKLIHIERYDIISSLPPHLKKKVGLNEKQTQIKQYINPPNDFERLNDPLVKYAATLCVEWENVHINNKNIINNDYLNTIVLNSLKELKII